MGIWQRIFGGERQERRALSTWDLLKILGPATATGQVVAPVVVEGLSSAYAAVELISESVSSLPLIVYRRQGDGVRQAEATHPVARLFTGGPNPLMSPTEFVCTMQANCLLHGHAVAEIVRDGNGRPSELWPLLPANVAMARIPRTRKVVYEHTAPEGGTRRLLPSEVLVIRDRFDDPFTPRSRIERTREAIAGAIGTERFAASLWRNGARLSGIVSHPEQIGSEAAKTLRESLQALYGGAEHAGKIGVLEEGAEWKDISSTPHDAELSEARRLAVREVARIFGVPPPLLADLGEANYSNLLELRRQFAATTITAWLTRWEQAIHRDLFTDAGRRQYEVEFDMDLLVRADYLQRLQGYRIGREIGLYSANDLRRFEHLNTRTDEDAEAFLSPLNMQREQTGGPRQGDD